MNVLLVDDEPAVCRVVEAYLDSLGHVGLIAYDAEQALEIGQREDTTIDALLLDIELPTMDGPELAVEFARLHGERPLIFMSARTHGPEGELFLRKPFRPAELAQMLERATKRSKPVVQRNPHA